MPGLEMKYFVLSPASNDKKHAEASRYAMRAYANAIEISKPEMAKQMRFWIDSIESPTGNIEFEEAYTVLDALMNNDPRVTVSGRPRLDHEGADIRQKPPRNLLAEPPEGWFVERDERTKMPTGNLVRTEDGVRKWYTDPMFREMEP